MYTALGKGYLLKRNTDHTVGVLALRECQAPEEADSSGG